MYGTYLPWPDTGQMIPQSIQWQEKKITTSNTHVLVKRLEPLFPCDASTFNLETFQKVFADDDNCLIFAVSKI